MERERPDYLPALERRRWEFPWLLLIAICLIGLGVAGVLLMGKTNAAWSERFERASANVAPETTAIAPVSDDALRQARLAEIRLRREAAEAEARNARKISSKQFKCVAGTVFKRIDGGWENVPNTTCDPREWR